MLSADMAGSCQEYRRIVSSFFLRKTWEDLNWDDALFFRRARRPQGIGPRLTRADRNAGRAALAVEHGRESVTYISDFARFLGFSAVTSLTNEKLQRLDHNLPPYGRTIRFFPDRLGQGVNRQTRNIAESLRSLGFEFQQRFELAEISAKLLAETVGPPGERLAKALGDSYASKAVINVRLQLYRALIIDLCAAFLDRHSRACSIRSIIDKLEGPPDLIPALREYRSDPNAYEITIEPPIGEGPLVEQVVRRATDLERQMLSANLREGITTEWRNIKMRSDLLTKTEAERLKWIRDKAIAHWEWRDDGLVPLS